MVGYVVCDTMCCMRKLLSDDVHEGSKVQKLSTEFFIIIYNYNLPDRESFLWFDKLIKQRR